MLKYALLIFNMHSDSCRKMSINRHVTFIELKFYFIKTHLYPSLTDYFAVLHYNENASRGQAQTKTGNLRWSRSFPKSRGHQEVLKPIRHMVYIFYHFIYQNNFSGCLHTYFM